MPDHEPSYPAAGSGRATMVGSRRMPSSLPRVAAALDFGLLVAALRASGEPSHGHDANAVPAEGVALGIRGPFDDAFAVAGPQPVANVDCDGEHGHGP